MKAEAQRIAIAEAVGFDHWVILKQGWYYRPNAAGYTNSLVEAWKLPYAEAKKYEMYVDNPMVPGNEKVFIERAPLPDYLNDLNAMHEAEKVLDTIIDRIESPRYRYSRILYNSVPADQQPFRATASQRAEAFLRTIGKWVES